MHATSLLTCHIGDNNKRIHDIHHLAVLGHLTQIEQTASVERKGDTFLGPGTHPRCLILFPILICFRVKFGTSAAIAWFHFTTESFDLKGEVSCGTYGAQR